MTPFTHLVKHFFNSWPKLTDGSALVPGTDHNTKTAGASSVHRRSNLGRCIHETGAHSYYIQAGQSAQMRIVAEVSTGEAGAAAVATGG